MKKTRLALVTLLLFSPAAFAGALTFDFLYSNIDTGASATGQLQIDSAFWPTILSNANSNFPISDLLNLSITITGASSGNGTFTAADFDQFVWWAAGANFDLNQNLVGQPTSANAWGTPDTNSGDFNFFSAITSPSAPTGVFFFNLGADSGAADSMQLTSLQATPEPGAMGMAALGGLAMLVISRRRGRSLR